MQERNKSITARLLDLKPTFECNVNEEELRGTEFLETMSGNADDSVLLGFEVTGEKRLFSSNNGWIKAIMISSSEGAQVTPIIGLAVHRVIFLSSLNQFLIFGTKVQKQQEEKPQGDIEGQEQEKMNSHNERIKKYLILLDKHNHQKGQLIFAWESTKKSWFSPRWIFHQIETSNQEKADKLIFVSCLMKARIIEVKALEDIKNLDLNFQEIHFNLQKNPRNLLISYWGPIRALCLIPQKLKGELLVCLHQNQNQDINLAFYSLVGTRPRYFFSFESLLLNADLPQGFIYSQLNMKLFSKKKQSD